MAKIFLVLTILAAGAAGFFGWETYQQVAVVKKNLSDSKDATKKANSQLVATQQTLKAAQLELADTHTKLDAANATILTDKSTNDALTAQLAPLQAQADADKTTIAALNKKIDDLTHVPNSPNTPNEDPQIIIKGLQNQIAELTEINKTLTTKAGEAVTRANALEAKEKTRVSGLIRPGIEGIVMAVNPGYNFAVVSLGDSQGAVPNAELLVKRGDTLIAKLKVTTVEPVLSVADIVPDSVVKGQRVLPGDKVIFSGNMAK